MCWITYKKEFTIPKIAEDNIVCNKIVYLCPNNIIKSAYNYFNYKTNILYEIGIEITTKYTIRGNYVIDYGFHSYNTNVKYVSALGIFSDAPYIRVYNNNDKIIDMYEAVKWDVSCKRGPLKEQLGLASCIIPKGATYFLNEKGEYVSNKIKMLSAFRIEK